MIRLDDVYNNNIISKKVYYIFIFILYVYQIIIIFLLSRICKHIFSEKTRSSREANNRNELHSIRHDHSFASIVVHKLYNEGT